MTCNGWRRPVCQEHEKSTWARFTPQVKLIKRVLCVTCNCATEQRHHFLRAAISKPKGIVEHSRNWGRDADTCCFVTLGAATSVLRTALLQFIVTAHWGNYAPVDVRSWKSLRGTQLLETYISSTRGNNVFADFSDITSALWFWERNCAQTSEALSWSKFLVPRPTVRHCVHKCWDVPYMLPCLCLR